MHKKYFNLTLQGGCSILRQHLEVNSNSPPTVIPLAGVCIHSRVLEEAQSSSVNTIVRAWSCFSPCIHILACATITASMASRAELCETVVLSWPWAFHKSRANDLPWSRWDISPVCHICFGYCIALKTWSSKQQHLLSPTWRRAVQYWNSSNMDKLKRYTDLNEEKMYTYAWTISASTCTPDLYMNGHNWSLHREWSAALYTGNEVLHFTQGMKCCTVMQCTKKN